MPITVTVNGQKEPLEESSSVLDLLERFDLEPQRVIVERNHEIVPRAAIDQVTLEDGDNIEIIRIVSGG